MGLPYENRPVPRPTVGVTTIGERHVWLFRISTPHYRFSGSKGVEPIDVLRRDDDIIATQSEFSDRAVGIIGSGLGGSAAPLFVPLPNKACIALESLGSCQVFGAVLLPMPLRTPEGCKT